MEFIFGITIQGEKEKLIKAVLIIYLEENVGVKAPGSSIIYGKCSSSACDWQCHKKQP